MATRSKGKFAKVVVGSSTALDVASCKIKIATDDLDVTDTGSNGYSEIEGGLRHAEGSFEAYWKASNFPYGTTPANLSDGSTVELKFYINKGDATPFLDVTLALLTSVDIDVPVDGTVKYTVSWKSTGSFVVASETGMT